MKLRMGTSTGVMLACVLAACLCGAQSDAPTLVSVHLHRLAGVHTARAGISFEPVPGLPPIT